MGSGMTSVVLVFVAACMLAYLMLYAGEGQ